MRNGGLRRNLGDGFTLASAEAGLIGHDQCLPVLELGAGGVRRAAPHPGGSALTSLRMARSRFVQAWWRRRSPRAARQPCHRRRTSGPRTQRRPGAGSLRRRWRKRIRCPPRSASRRCRRPGRDAYPVMRASDQPLKLRVDVGLVADTGDAEQALAGPLSSRWRTGGTGCGPSRGRSPRHLVLVLGVGDELASQVVRPPASEKPLTSGGVDQKRRGNWMVVGGSADSSRFTMRSRYSFSRRVLHRLVVALDHVGHGVAQPLLLLLAEDVRLGQLSAGGAGQPLAAAGQ